MNNSVKVFDNTVKSNSNFSSSDSSVLISDKDTPNLCKATNFKKISDNGAADLCGPADFEKLSDKDLYSYCKKVGFNARIWSRKFIAAIPEVAKRRLYKKYGYCSIHEFAAKLAGMSRDNVDAALRIDEKLKGMPKIKSLIGEIGLNKIRLVANVAKPETENFWAEKIQNMTKSSLEIFIRDKFRPGTECGKNTKNTQTEGQIDMFDLKTFRSQEEDVSIGKGSTIRNKKTFTIQIDDDTEFELRKFKQQLEKARKEPVDWNFTLKEMAKRASNEKLNYPIKSQPDVKTATARGSRTKPGIVVPKFKNGLVEKQKPVSRYIPAKIRHNLQQKHNGRCAYRGCNKPAEQIHHPKRFAVRPNHENLIPLCRAHHDFGHQEKADRIINKFKSENFAAGIG